MPKDRADGGGRRQGGRVSVAALTVFLAGAGLAPPVGAVAQDLGTVPGTAETAGERQVPRDARAMTEVIDLASVVRQALARRSRPVPAETMIVPLSRPDLIDTLRVANLDLALAEAQTRDAAAAVDEASAAFDPIFSTGLTYSRSYSYSRRDVVSRLRDGDVDSLLDSVDGGASDTDPANDDGGESTDSPTIGCLTVDGAVVSGSTGNYDCDLSPTYSSQVETASSANRAMPGQPVYPYAWTGNVALSQPLAFGGSVGLGMALTKRIKNYYTLSSGLKAPAFGVGDPFGWESRMPWTSEINVSFSTPLPFTRGFGSDGSLQHLAIATTEADSRRARADREARYNQVLQDALGSYWGLVQSGEGLRALVAHRQTLEEILERTRRQVALGMMTDYDLRQVESQLATLMDREEIAWNEYVTVSNRLAETLALDQAALFIPDDVVLSAPAPVPAVDLSDVLATHPGLLAAEESVVRAGAAVAYRDDQTRPDLRLGVSYGLSQTDNAFGYQSPNASLSHVLDPDNRQFAVSLRLSYRLGQRAEEAALSRARAEQTQANHRLDDARGAVSRAIDTAGSDLAAAQSLTDRASEDVRLAQLAVERGQRLQDEDLVSRHELLAKYDDLLTARLVHINAVIAQHRSTVRLLGAQGRLADYYGGGGGPADGSVTP